MPPIATTKRTPRQSQTNWPRAANDSVDDGTSDQDVPVQQAQFPSSFGLTFCVGCDTKELLVEASWGQYLKVKKEDQVNERTGSPLWVWKRHPRGGKLTIPVKGTTVEPVWFDAECPDVYVRGRIRSRDSHCVITLFLVNGQLEERPNKDRWYLFQPTLTVSAPDGSAIFEKKLDRPPSSTDPATKVEEQRMAMLYRRQVEFAVGHGVSVHADVSKERSDRALLVRTTAIPSYEVAKTTPPNTADAATNPAFGKLDGLVLDMKVLAETPQAQLRAKLEPLTLAYKTWIDAEEAKIGDPAEGLAPYKEAAVAAVAHGRRTLKRIEDGLTLVGTDATAFEAFRFMNRSMWLQRTRSLYSEQIRQGKDVHYDDVDEAKNRTWYPVPDGVHPAERPERDEVRPLRPQRRPRGHCRPAVLSNRWREVRGVISASRPTRWACGGFRAPWRAAAARTASPS